MEKVQMPGMATAGMHGQTQKVAQRASRSTTLSSASSWTAALNFACIMGEEGDGHTTYNEHK